MDKNLTNEAVRTIENFLFKKFIVAGSAIGAIGLVVGWFLNDIAVQSAKNEVYQQYQSVLITTVTQAAQTVATLESLKSNFEEKLKKLEKMSETVEQSTIDKLADKLNSSSKFKNAVKKELSKKINDAEDKIASHGDALKSTNEIMEIADSEINKKIETDRESISLINNSVQKNSESLTSFDKKLSSFKIIEGEVPYNVKGSIGSEYRVYLKEKGVYELEFNTPFSGPFVFNAIPIVDGSEGYTPYIEIERYTKKGVIVNTKKFHKKLWKDKTPANFSWKFIAVGRM